MTQMSARELHNLGNFGMPFHLAPDEKSYLDDLPLLTVDPIATPGGPGYPRQSLFIKGHILAVCPLNGRIFFIPDEVQVIFDL